MKNHNSKINSGFTLLETIIYIGLSVSILLIVINIFMSFSSTKTKINTVHRVINEGEFIMKKVTQTVKNGKIINLPEPGSNSPLLSMDMIAGVDSPVNIYLTDGDLILEEAGVPKTLNTNNININSLTFNNYSYENTPGIIRIEMEVEYNNLGNRKEFDFTQTFTSSAALK